MSHIVYLRMIDLDTNEDEILYDQEESKCHLKKRFNSQKYNIQLRLDWDNITKSQPKLDADIEDKKTGRLLRKGRWQHTNMRLNSQAETKSYYFKFGNLELRLGAVKNKLTPS